MSQWVIKGLQTGIKTTRYPAHEETQGGVSPGLPLGREHVTDEQGRHLVDLCPTGAIALENGRLRVEPRRCVHCFRCSRTTHFPLDWRPGYEWASYASGRRAASPPWPKVFSRSLHILVVDAGDCGACLNEVKQLNNPYYNIHRLGFFITPTPRQADILLVVGPVTDHMRIPLLVAYEAMPTPKLVMAVGTCALSGGVFGPSFVSGGGVAETIPVDLEVPGSPPPPLAILHGLLVAAGQKDPVTSTNAAKAGASA
jgi:Ni,Fe-hydrogenase III small subunit